MAVRVGFEPTEPVKVQRFSRPPDSTALAPHRTSRLPDLPGSQKHLKGSSASAFRVHVDRSTRRPVFVCRAEWRYLRRNERGFLHMIYLRLACATPHRGSQHRTHLWLPASSVFLLGVQSLVEQHFEVCLVPQPF